MTPPRDRAAEMSEWPRDRPSIRSRRPALACRVPGVRVACSHVHRLGAHQLAALRAHERERYVEQLVAHARTSFPDGAGRQKPDAVHRQAEQALARAEQHGITDERSAAMFFGLQLALGSDFADSTEAQEVLGYRALPAEQRMERLYAAHGDAPGLSTAREHAQASFESRPIGEPVVRCEPTSLEIELLDEHGCGVGHEPVEIVRLPVGPQPESFTTKLDERGQLVVDGLPPGEYLVRFPRRAHVEPDIRTWIAFRLDDEHGNPMAFEPFRIVFADGEVLEATRDASGRLVVGDVVLAPGRACAVSLRPGREVEVELDAGGHEVRIDHVAPGDALIMFTDREELIAPAERAVDA